MTEEEATKPPVHSFAAVDHGGKQKSRTSRDMQALVNKLAIANGIDPSTLHGAGRNRLKAICRARAMEGKQEMKRRKPKRGNVKVKNLREDEGPQTSEGGMPLHASHDASKQVRKVGGGGSAWQLKADKCKRHKKLVELRRHEELEEMFAEREKRWSEVQRLREIHIERVRVQRRWMTLHKVMVAAARLKVALVEAGAQDANARQREMAERTRARERIERIIRDTEIERRSRVALYGTEENIELRARCRAFSTEVAKTFVNVAQRRKKNRAFTILHFLTAFAANSRKLMIVMKRYRAKVTVCQRAVRKHIHVHRTRTALLRELFNKYASSYGHRIWERVKDARLRQDAIIMTAEARDDLVSLGVRRIPNRLAVATINECYQAMHAEYKNSTKTSMSGEASEIAYNSAEMRGLLSYDTSHHNELALLMYKKRRIKRPPFLFFSLLKTNKHETLTRLVRTCYERILLNYKPSTKSTEPSLTKKKKRREWQS